MSTGDNPVRRPFFIQVTTENAFVASHFHHRQATPIDSCRLFIIVMCFICPLTFTLQTRIKAGYVIQYGGPEVNQFYFLTVNGAGHMVPQV